MKIGINKITETNHKAIYELKRVTLSKESRKISSTAILYLQPGHANSGSSESDLVSGKMNEAVIDTIVIQHDNNI